MSETTNIAIHPIGQAHSPLKQKFGAPRQPNLVDILTEIELFAPYNTPQWTNGLEQFSHIWVMWRFSEIMMQAPKPMVRPPRLGGNQKVGVFASRSMFRPNQIGLSVVRLKSVLLEKNNVRLQVLGADFIDKTPILDIKPYIRYSDAINDAASGYALEQPNKKIVQWDNKAEIAFRELQLQNELCAEDKELITDLIALDPRPAYVNDSKSFNMRYKQVDVVFYGMTKDDTDDSLCISDIVYLDDK